MASSCNSYATGNVNVDVGDNFVSNVGGLVGFNQDYSQTSPAMAGSIVNSHATGDVTDSTGGGNIGGLAGLNSGSNISESSYAPANPNGGVTDTSATNIEGGFSGSGGLVGTNQPDGLVGGQITG